MTRSRSLVILVVSILTLAACATDATVTPTPTPAPTPSSTLVPTPTPTGVEAAAQDRVAKIVGAATLVRLWSDPPTLDPHLTADTTSSTIVVEVFGGLVTIDPELEIIPDLAERWDLTNGGRTYTFHLRRDGKFHDGSPFTAHDFKWYLERAANPLTGSPVVDTYLGDIVGVQEKLQGRATDIAGIQVIDEYTLGLTIDDPKAYFLSKLTYPTAFVLDRNNVEGNPAWLREPNGTGPFRLANYVPNAVLTLNRNENYHLGPPKLEEVRFILSGGDPLLMYANDEIHITEIGLAGPEPILDPPSIR